MADLSKMNAAELMALAKEATALAGEKEEQEKQALRQEVKDLIAARGYTFEDLFGAPEAKASEPPAGASKSKSEPKYVNPDDPSQTWTGRGRKPKWLVEAESAGRPVSDFAL